MIFGTQVQEQSFLNIYIEFTVPDTFEVDTS